MTFEELEHAIRAATEVAADTEVIVFGSQAILGEFPDAHHDLTQSAEVDMTPKNRPDKVDAIDGALGEGSRFHGAHGFYVHGVPVEAATLPIGWKARLVRVATRGTNGRVGWCLEGHDLAASKLAAFRDKDREFVRVLLREGYIRSRTLVSRIRRLPKPDPERERLARWVHLTVQDLGDTTHRER